MLYIYRRREKVDRLVLVFVTAVLLCYAQFPFWPSEPPRVVFFGQDFPAYDTIFRRFNWWMLGNYGIHTSVFPSAHVAGAFGATFGIWRAVPERRRLRCFLMAMAVLIAAATVYGRYHYLGDAAAGLAMALLATGISEVVERLCAPVPSHLAHSDQKRFLGPLVSVGSDSARRPASPQSRERVQHREGLPLWSLNQQGAQRIAMHLREERPSPALAVRAGHAFDAGVLNRGYGQIDDQRASAAKLLDRGAAGDRHILILH
jgi:hypothetical protein